MLPSVKIALSAVLAIFICFADYKSAKAAESEVCNLLTEIVKLSNKSYISINSRDNWSELLAKLEEMQRKLRAGAYKTQLSISDTILLKSRMDRIAERMDPARNPASKSTVDRAVAALFTNTSEMHEFAARNGCAAPERKPLGAFSAAIETESPGAQIRTSPSRGYKSGLISKRQPLADKVGGPAELASPSYLHAFALALGLVVAATSTVFLKNRSMRQWRRYPCNVTALVQHGDKSTVTFLINISRGGAQIQAPMGGIQGENIRLFVGGHQLTARKTWSNKYYMGVAFDSPIPNSTMNEIKKPVRHETMLMKISENAPSCFFPGCHLTCVNHRQTQISAEHADKAA